MHRVKPLPPYLAERYRNWSETTLTENRDHFRRLARDGQHPDTMIIACCDSRVQASQVFGPHPGETFIHRNIANLVPRYRTDQDMPGTAAAVEYAVKVLKVEHIIVMGHSACGGVEACNDMCDGHAPELETGESFIGTWLNELRPAHARVRDIPDREHRLTAMEKEGVHVSLENLMGYPFVAEAVEAERLWLHGIWVEIADGSVETYDGHLKRFSPM